MMTNDEKYLLTYNINAFRELRVLFRNVTDYFKLGSQDLDNYYNTFPPGIRSFLNAKEWKNRITEIQKNTAGEEAFRKRFFGWFNMFRIVKYLNNVHAGIFEKQMVEVSAREFLNLAGRNFESDDPGKLLILFRQLEKM